MLKPRNAKLITAEVRQENLKPERGYCRLVEKFLVHKDKHAIILFYDDLLKNIMENSIYDANFE